MKRSLSNNEALNRITAGALRRQKYGSMFKSLIRADRSADQALGFCVSEQFHRPVIPPQAMALSVISLLRSGTG
jgi:hypothetical protein